MSDDLISRQAALYALHLLSIEALKKHRFDYDALITICSKKLKDLPSVHPKQKTGRWIYTNTIGGMRYYGCTICTNQEKDCIADENEIQWYNYCPNCGAKMESDKNDN